MLPAVLRAELINQHFLPRLPSLVMIDFDGTVSLLREGWEQVMIPMMVEELQHLPGTHESAVTLKQEVTNWVLKLNGQPTIQQMKALVEEVRLRQGSPRTPEEYKAKYLERLMETVRNRKEEIRPEQRPYRWVVPGTYQLLEGLRKRKRPMLLASGTDLDSLREESRLLEIDHYFTEGIAGPESDTSTFTKAAACDAMLQRHELPGNELLNFGDGYVETRLTKERGGIAIGIAYDPERPGEYNPWRKEQLLRAGADIILPDLQQSELLLHWLSGA
ncbi:MAG TPA: HAD family hydrolase [Gemmatales bacterium]|nr:HAD family hydrolase [Gemmatales bacterium]